MNLQKSKLLLNSFAAIAQILVVGIIYLLLYHYLLKIIGIELLGVWSLIIATTSLALIANFGLSVSIIKFVAVYYAKEDIEGLKKLIFTSSIFILGTYTFIAVILQIGGAYILSFLINDEYLDVALNVLPFSLISLVVNAIGGVVSSSLEGLQKNYIRSNIISLSSILLFIISLLLTPHYGLQGLVQAQIIQAIFVLAVSAYYINKYVPGVLSFKWNWSKSVFKEIFSYGMKMQALSIMQMTFEPVTKAFLTKFGGLAMVGYYEMANRLVSQIRSILVSANQVVIPVVAQAHETNEKYVREIYIKSFSVLFLFNVTITAAVIIFAPLISSLWIGKFIPFFIFSVVLNSCVAFINICSNPAYFSFLGEGKLKLPIYQYLLITPLNIILGYLLGIQFGGYGVIAAWNIAFMSGSLLIIISYHILNSIKYSEIFSLQDLKLFVAATVMAITGFYAVVSLQCGKNNYIAAIAFTISLFIFLKFFIQNRHLCIILHEVKKLVLKTR